MSEVNKNGNTAAPKVDTRKTEINKASLIFNQLGIWIIVAGLIILGMIISKGQFFGKSNIQSILEAASGRAGSSSPDRYGLCRTVLRYIFRKHDRYVCADHNGIRRSYGSTVH